ncbi:serine/threonine protein kinase [Microbispora sp. RL4-1S]|uniref:non-specific serine/threonine protein kinase n=2 Tax=Microbispora oryzae TaxID=2806554 RepID=A0A940WDY4_9ACTN|nr:serine/threonine protein kinase [Microbispora oryzae]
MGTGARELLADRYRLLSPVRRNGGGIMWHAHDLRLKRDVAIKEVQPPYEPDVVDLAAARRQALREARSAARLSHPAVITVHDLLEDKGRLWIVTELLQGLTLSETVRHLGRLPVHWAAWVGFQLLSGVRHAHTMGVVHGDIRPGNVLLTEDRVVLTDFGIAAFDRGPDTSATVPNLRAGPYLAPERLRDQVMTPAADLWSFGATLYCGVEGRPPHLGAEPAGHAGLTGPAAPTGPGGFAGSGETATREPGAPRRAGPLREVLDGLLRPDPADRLSADEATKLLAEVLRRQGIPAAPPGRSSGELPAARPAAHTPAHAAVRPPLRPSGPAQGTDHRGWPVPDHPAL